MLTSDSSLPSSSVADRVNVSSYLPETECHGEHGKNVHTGAGSAVPVAIFQDNSLVFPFDSNDIDRA